MGDFWRTFIIYNRQWEIEFKKCILMLCRGYYVKTIKVFIVILNVWRNRILG